MILWHETAYSAVFPRLPGSLCMCLFVNWKAFWSLFHLWRGTERWGETRWGGPEAVNHQDVLHVSRSRLSARVISRWWKPPRLFLFKRGPHAKERKSKRGKGGVWGHEIGHRRSGSDFESNWDRRWWSTLCVRVVVCLCGDHAVKAKARLCDNQGLDLFCFAQQNNPSPKVLECRGRNEGGRKLKKKKRPTAIVWNFSA